MPSRLHLDLACHALAAGGVIAYPTEGVWGLGCEPLNQHACRRIQALKRRAARKGFILLASEFAQVEPFLVPIARPKLKPVLASWPGPVTWLLPAASWVPAHLTGERRGRPNRVGNPEGPQTIDEWFNKAAFSP
ncbi:MAG: L-threonylcarbamoyladenylate synthase, partial [Burkholderiales bacterium]